MAKADSVHSTPRTDSSLSRLSERELNPKDVLAELLQQGLHPDPEWMADRVIERLKDAGFVIWPYEAPKPPKAKGSPMEDLKREIERLKDAKRRALAMADLRAREAQVLRVENEQLRRGRAS